MCREKVYATARDPRTVTHPDAVPLALEVSDPAFVAAAAEQAQDVTLLINNGSTPRSPPPESVAAQALDGIGSDAYEVLADDLSRQVKAGLAADLAVLYPQLAA